MSKKFKIFEKKDSGWEGKKMKISKNFLPSNKWVTNKLVLGKSLNFDKHNDFLIIPEIWAHFANDLNLKKKILIMRFLFKVFFIWSQQIIFRN